MDADLLADCHRFVEAQSEGEWGDDLVAKDAARLATFVELWLSAAIAQAHAAGLEEAAKVADDFYVQGELEGILAPAVIASRIRAQITTTGGGENG